MASELNVMANRPANVPEERVIDWDMYNPPGIAAGLYESWQRLHAPGVPDLVWTARNGGHWIATRGKLIERMFKDYEHFSSKCIWIPVEAGQQYKFIPTSMDPPEHQPFRAAINAGIGLRVAKTLGNSIRATARQLIQKLQPGGECNFTTDYAEPLPISVFLALVDLPAEDAPRLKKIVDKITRMDGSISMADASQLLFDYLAPVVAERMARPGDDAISVIINTKVKDRAMTAIEAQRVCGLLLLAGLDTVVNFLSFVMLYLANNPTLRRDLAACPEKIPAAVEEFFRLLPLVADGRMVAKDIVVDGVQLKVGQMVLLPTMLHGLDERENECPTKFDTSRKRVGHSFFGGGVHRCAGLHIARAEVTVTLEEWLAEIPEFSVAPGTNLAYQSGVVATLSSLPLVWSV
jgi:camphor 5-monooxygenase